MSTYTSGGVSARPLRRLYQHRLLREDLLAVLLFSSVAVVVALFLADGGAYGFSTLAGALTQLGILAGLVGTDLIFVMLLLAARLPVVDRTIGQDRALQLHRKLGKPALYLLLAHTVLLLAGYGALEKLNPFGEAVSMWTTMADMPLAFIGMGLLIAVVVSSLVAVRRRYPYEVWHGIHLLSYAAVLAALPHQFSTGELFAEGTAQRWYWIALYAGTLLALAYYRIGLPVYRTLHHDLRVAQVVSEGPGTFSVYLAGRDLAGLRARAGQFFVWRFLAPGVWWHAHPFSLSADPVPSAGQGYLRITVRDLGRGSAQLAQLKPGTRAAIEGPYGLFSELARTARRVVMVAAGIGITPVRSLLEGSSFAPGQAVVILRAPDEAGLYLYQEIHELCVARGAVLYTEVGRRRTGSWLPEGSAANGYTLASYAPWTAEADVYVCGPRDWADLVVQDAQACGASANQIHHERFSW
jgi:predicted ferric reductase